MTAIAHRSPDPDSAPGPVPDRPTGDESRPKLRLIRLDGASTSSGTTTAAPVRRFADVAPWVAPRTAGEAPDESVAGPAGSPPEHRQPSAATSRLVAEHIRRTQERRLTDEGEEARSARRREAQREEQRHVARVVRLVGQSTFEVLAGVRPLDQLTRWLDAPTFERLQQRLEIVFGQPINPRMPAAALLRAPESGHSGPNTRGGATRPTQTPVQRVRVCRAAEHAYEASVVVNVGGRLRAAAVRLELRRGQWKVCALELG
ncbi:Rv3235 family protein [Zhihengliuella sp.]|uniref:Rv3235 family protein n=1 Tax=Zhihengliuella sp. TaxID=1954483 RepID=UPI00281289AC|nr:Rv3235 family protein [Zhihengliuella sp.]